MSLYQVVIWYAVTYSDMLLRAVGDGNGEQLLYLKTYRASLFETRSVTVRAQLPKDQILGRLAIYFGIAFLAIIDSVGCWSVSHSGGRNDVCATLDDSATTLQYRLVVLQTQMSLLAQRPSSRSSRVSGV